MSDIIIYTFTRSFEGLNIPLPIQNIYLRNYCLSNNLRFTLPMPEFPIRSNFSKFKEIIDMNHEDKKVLCTSLLMFSNMPSSIKIKLQEESRFIIIGALENTHIWSDNLEKYIEEINDYNSIAINGGFTP